MRQEIIEKRSEYAKHFINDDGTRVAEIYTYPVHYKDRDTQAWEESTYLIEPDTQVAGFDHNMKHGPFRSRFGPDQVRFGFAEGKYVTYKFQGANNVTPMFDAHKATFAGLYTQTDVVYSILSKELKQEIILADATAPETFKILLDGNVTPELVDNSVAFKDGDTMVGSIPAPFAIDANGDRGPVTFALNADVLTITADSVWLATAVYPVTIDPTTTIQPDAMTGKDTYVDANSPAENYGSAATLKIGKFYGYEECALLQFDLSSIPTEIVSAQLALYWWEGTVSDIAVTCHRILTTWVENTVTYGTIPSYDSSAESTTSVSYSSAWNYFDVSNMVIGWQNGSYSNYGVMLKSITDAWEGFYSSDYVTDTTLRPKLIVVYRQASPTISVPASTTPASPTTYSNEVSPAITFAHVGTYTQSNYQMQAYDSDSNLVYDSGSVSGTALTMSIPIGYLLYNNIYGVRVRCMDSSDSAWSEWSILHYFQCTMTAPTDLVAGADPTAARISLSWTAHIAENVAGYNVYRKLPIEADTAYAKANLDGLIAATTWHDEFVAYGKGYDYKVVAVARDGYESPTSAAVSNISVTFTSWWLGSVPFDVSPREIQPKRINVVNRRQIMGKNFEAVQRAVLGHEITLSAKFLSEDTLQAFMAEWARTDKVLALRDNRGRVWRVQAVSDLDYPQTWAIGRNIYAATMTFVEVG